MSVVMIVTEHDALAARQVLLWFAKQAEEVQIRIMRRKYREFMRLKNMHPKISKPALDLAALVLAAQHSGWADERAYRSSKSVSEVAAKQISERRRARAKAYRPHRDQVRVWLAKHWGKVMDIRAAGLSWRRMARVIADEHGISISHTTLYSYWRRWNEQE